MSGLQVLATSPVVHTLGITLLHFLWQGALVAAGLRLVLAVLAQRPAQVRYAASCLALALMAVIPAVTFLLLLPAQPFHDHVAGALAPDGDPGSTGYAAWWAPLTVVLWLVGATALILRLFASLHGVERLRRHGLRRVDGRWQDELDRLRNELGVRQAVRLFESSLAQAPMVVGWLRPMVLLPTCALTGLTPDHLRAILAHELAHVRRLDFLVNLFQALVESVLFYHPAVWWVSKRIRIERELCCDDVAVASCGDVLTYARALLELERSQDPAPQVVLGANGGSLMQRIQRLVNTERRPAGASHGWAPAGLLAVVLLALAPVAAFAQEPGDSDKLCPECEAKVRVLLQHPQDAEEGHLLVVPQILRTDAEESGGLLTLNGRIVSRDGVVLHDVELQEVEADEPFAVEWKTIENEPLSVQFLDGRSLEVGIHPFDLEVEIHEEDEAEEAHAEGELHFLTEIGELHGGEGEHQVITIVSPQGGESEEHRIKVIDEDGESRVINIYIQGNVQIEGIDGGTERVRVHRSHGDLKVRRLDGTREHEAHEHEAHEHDGKHKHKVKERSRHEHDDSPFGLFYSREGDDDGEREGGYVRRFFTTEDPPEMLWFDRDDEEGEDEAHGYWYQLGTDRSLRPGVYRLQTGATLFSPQAPKLDLQLTAPHRLKWRTAEPLNFTRTLPHPLRITGSLRKGPEKKVH